MKKVLHLIPFSIQKMYEYLMPLLQYELEDILVEDCLSIQIFWNYYIYGLYGIEITIL